MADDTTTPGILINATYRVRIDDTEAFKALAARMAVAARERDGCAFLKVGQDVNDPTTFYLFEGWRDRDALDTHIASDDFQGIMQEAGKLKITDRFADTYVVSGSMSLDMPS